MRTILFSKKHEIIVVNLVKAWTAVATGTALLVLANGCGAAVMDDIKYVVSPFRLPGKSAADNIAIEQLRITPSDIVLAPQAEKINRQLAQLTAGLAAEAAACHEPDDPGLWNYKIAFDQLHHVGDTLSVVFSGTSVCGGEIDIRKIARTFSVATGDQITPLALVKQHAPTLMGKGSSATTASSGALKLGPDAVSALVRENGVKLDLEPGAKPDSQARAACLAYLHRVGHTVWLRGDQLVLQPMFNHPESLCYKEYTMPIKP